MNKPIIKIKKAFTLVELLVSIGILSILVAGAVLVINPTEYIKQSRDSKRMSDLSNLNVSLTKIEYSGKRTISVLADRVYVSLPDSSADCSSWDLPDLVLGASYVCSLPENYMKNDGSGWVPIDLSQSGYAEFLPTDPTNSSSTFYFYSVSSSGGYVLGAYAFESGRYGFEGSSDKVSTDGGLNSHSYEIGSNLSFHRWQ